MEVEVCVLKVLEPKNVGRLQKPEKTRNGFSLRASRRTRVWPIQFRLLTSRTVR